jgi:hypothetical protein
VRPFRSNEQHLIDPKGIWLIKKSKIENGGTQIEGKDDKLVIQHVLSGRYLASSDDGYASLSSELWEKNVCWSLQSYSGSGEYCARGRGVDHSGQQDRQGRQRSGRGYLAL